MINLFRLPIRSAGKEDSENALLRRACEGDRTSFDQLLDHYSVELRRFVARRLPGEDVDDVLQEAWLAAWVGLSSFDRRSRFKTWLYALALNKCRDYHRSRLRLEITTPHMREGVDDGQMIQYATEMHDTASALLSSLSPSQREVLELYYYAELTMPEIAKALGRNLNTVKYQFYRGHVQASEYLENMEQESKRSFGNGL